jgi:hypothetical protein
VVWLTHTLEAGQLTTSVEVEDHDDPRLAGDEGALTAAVNIETVRSTFGRSRVTPFLLGPLPPPGLHDSTAV